VFTLHGTVSGRSVTYRLAEGDSVAGRSPSCQLVIAPPSVSRRHARFRVSNGRCFVADLNSRCGTYVGGGRIHAETEVVAGDQIRLGEVALTLDHTESRVQFDAGEVSGATIVRKVGERSSAGQSEIRTAERVLGIFADIGRLLLSVRPLPQVLARVAEVTFDVLPNERVFLLLADPAAPEGLRASVSLTRGGGTPADEVRISRTVIRRVMDERVAMLAADVQSDRRLDSSQSLVAQAVRSFMCAPLQTQDRVAGVLYVDTRHTPFTDADLEAFSALASYAAIGIEQARLAEGLLREARRRERLQRYHSASVIERILHAGEEADTQFIAQEVDVTVLFCDIVSFTTLCEGLAPNDTVSLLNGFFSKMCDVVFQHEGTLDKFLGDGMMVLFNAPFTQPDHPIRAARTALAMRRALAEFNQDQIIPLEVRIGIASGRAMVGDVGTIRRREFTVLGDVVNTAARLQTSVAAPGQIVLAASTAARVGDALPMTPMGKVPVRGRIGEVEVYRLTE
jgi:adenylate cyclase